uniref:Fibronectin type-III domain-containing protein n=1 Tax=Caldanaerobacter subterraneus subsp. tengcongensis (strain DSM 15242 / JCM 11007 / NBRC 100824 / MB4) TaxID=273068 RepID=UPI001C4DD90F|nr:Chain A, Fibronectin type-III domain-containing protein [Caldanaerobacter subterraneus subsp. tengcongensis MB4]
MTVPDEPVGFWVESIPGNDHTLLLTWSETKGAKYYEIYLVSDSTYKFIASTDKLEYYVTNLSPNTKYTFALIAVNELGPSNFVTASSTTDRGGHHHHHH